MQAQALEEGIVDGKGKVMRLLIEEALRAEVRANATENVVDSHRQVLVVEAEEHIKLLVIA